MKKLFSLLIITAVFTVFSQTTEAEGTLKKELAAEHKGWKTGGVVSVNFSQAAFSSNWAAGTENSLTVNSLVSVFANFSDGKNIWENTLDLGYGFLKQGSADIVKSDDKIDLTSKYGRKAFADWYYAGLFNFKSQMTPTEVMGVKVSEFLSPASILAAAGMDWKPTECLSVFISPITYRANLVMNDDFLPEGADNVDSNIGGYLRAIYKKEVFKNINFESKFELFANYQEDEEKDQKPQNMDINWSNLLAMKVNEYLSANFTFEMVVDDNNDLINKEVQFKEVLGIGLAYKF